VRRWVLRWLGRHCESGLEGAERGKLVSCPMRRRRYRLVVNGIGTMGRLRLDAGCETASKIRKKWRHGHGVLAGRWIQDRFCPILWL